MSRVKGSTLLINDVPFEIYRDGRTPGITAGTFGPTDATVETPNREFPIMMTDFSGGMGVCREIKEAPNTYAFGVNACTRYKGLVLPAGRGTLLSIDNSSLANSVVTSLWFKNNLYVFTKRYIYRRVLGDGAFTEVYTTGGTTTRITSAIVYNNQIVVGQEQDDGSLVRSGLLLVSSTGDSSSWTSNTMRGRLLAQVYWKQGGNGGQRLIVTTSGTLAQDGTGQSVYNHSYMRTLLNATVTTETNWTAAVPIGNISYEIKSISTGNQTIFFVKTEGICDVDERGYSPNRTPRWRDYFNTTNGIASIYHDGYVWASHAHGLDRLDTESRIRDDDPDWCGPGQGLTNFSPIFGQIQAMTVDDGWIVAAVWNGQHSYVMYGKERRKIPGAPDGPTPVVWHGSEATIHDERITHMQIVSPGNRQPYMLICTMEGTVTKVHEWSLPNKGNAVQEILNNLLNAPAYSHQFSPFFKLFLTTRTWEDESARKVVRAFDFITDFLNAQTTDGTRLRAFANADGGIAIWNDQPMRRTSFTPPETGTYTVSLEDYVDAEHYVTEIDAPDWDEFLSSASYRTTYAATVESAINAAITVAGTTLPFLDVTARVVKDTPQIMINTDAYRTVCTVSAGTPLWTYLGRITNSPRESFLPTTDVEVGYQISICIVGEGTYTVPPLLYAAKVRAEVIVDQLELKTYQLVLGSYVQQSNRSKDPTPVPEMWARLWTLQNRGPVTVDDEWEEEVQAKIEPPVTYQEVREPHGQEITLVATVNMSILRRGGYWDTGFVWGDPLVWG